MLFRSMQTRNAAGIRFTESDKIYLGRRGFVKASLVARSDQFAAALPQFRQAIDGFAYAPENSYPALVEGDPLAKYGLNGLSVAAGSPNKQESPGDLLIAVLIMLAYAGIRLLINRLSSKKQAPVQVP